MNAYRHNFPNDPLNIWPNEPSDWNALMHDLGSFGGLIPEAWNHLVYAYREFQDFLEGADLFHLFSGPFIAIFGTASSVVSAAIDVAGAAVDFSWGAMQDFFSALADAWQNLSEFDFIGAVQDFLSGIGDIFHRFGTVIGVVMDTITPVVLDMDGDGVELISLEDSEVLLDLDGDGLMERTGWVSADDAILGFDRNGDGLVNGVDEYSFADAAAGYDTDLEGLAAYDSNGDGVLDASDDGFDRFLIWQDLNGDGVCDAGEARTLSEAGVTAIRLALNGDSRLQNGHSIYNTTVWTEQNGQEHEALDVGFRAGRDVSVTRTFDWGQVTAGADGIFVDTNGRIDLSDFLEEMGRLISRNEITDWQHA